MYTLYMELHRTCKHTKNPLFLFTHFTSKNNISVIKENKKNRLEKHFEEIVYSFIEPKSVIFLLEIKYEKSIHSSFRLLLAPAQKKREKKFQNSIFSYRSCPILITFITILILSILLFSV